MKAIWKKILAQLLAKDKEIAHLHGQAAYFYYLQKNLMPERRKYYESVGKY